MQFAFRLGAAEPALERRTFFLLGDEDLLGGVAALEQVVAIPHNSDAHYVVRLWDVPEPRLLVESVHNDCFHTTACFVAVGTAVVSPNGCFAEVRILAAQSEAIGKQCLLAGGVNQDFGGNIDRCSSARLKLDASCVVCFEPDYFFRNLKERLSW